MPTTHKLDDSLLHYAWDNALVSRLSIDAGDSVIFDTRDAVDHYYTLDSTSDDVKNKGPLTGHPLTGPVYVRDAQPGDTLVVDVLEVVPSLGFGWTAIRPGRGLLPEAEFPNHFLQLWDLEDGQIARMKQRNDIAIPIAAFPGIMGTALDEIGQHSTIPPRKNGGNMDIKHLCKGSTLYLPVWVDGAMFSVGDAHAAQGDGEVCITAIEMSATVTLRFDLCKGARIEEPRLRVRGSLSSGKDQDSWFATTANGPDLYECSQRAIRYMIEHIVRERGLSREEAYVLCSVCVDLKISEIVDAPNWIVSAFLPEFIFC
ncbi:MAG: acetamidase/formamidase [Gammaproteobacteria bacterium]|jgi:acetamidase/formamidase